MNIIEKFQYHSEREEWSEALPFIEEIVRKQDSFSTSWFNYGVCLEGLNRNIEAANAFKTAYQLEPEDYGCQYRIFHNLSLAKDVSEFIKFAEKEISKVPEILELIAEEEEFKEITNSNEYSFFIKRIGQ